ncbi:MAG: putative phosphoribosyltransferase [Maribacter sp.]|jgi:predicted phosphoribosyltransferase
MFKDRIDAGNQLAKQLLKFKNEEVVVVAIPRGGLPLAAIVAKTLNAPLDVALSKKIGHPYNSEYAIGAVSLDHFILSDAMGVTKGYIEEEAVKLRKKLQERYRQYYSNRKPESLKGKTVVIVDDGIATGNTLLVTVAFVAKQRPKKVIAGVPVASASAIQALRDSDQIDEIVCLEIPRNFRAVGQFYKEFSQVSDEEAIQLLEQNNSSRSTNG